MAIITFNQSDTIETFVTKMNELERDNGDLYKIDQGAYTNTVDAINGIRTQFSTLDDSAKITQAIRERGFSLFAVGTLGLITYRDSTGQFNFYASDSSNYVNKVSTIGGAIAFDSSTMVLDGDIDAGSITDGTMAFAKEVEPVEFIISDSDGNSIVTLRSPKV